MLTVWSGWWWDRKTWVTASGATPSAASGSRMSDRRATIPGSTTIRASPSRTRTIDDADPVARVAGVEQVDGGHAGRPDRYAGRRAADCAGPSRTASRDPAPVAAHPACPPPGRLAPMPDDRQPADLVLTGGRSPPMDAARRTAEALAVRDGRIVAVGLDRGRAAARRAADARHRARAAGRSCPASRTPTSTRPTAAWRRSAATSTTSAARRRVPRARSPPTPARIPDAPWILGGGWYMADFPGGTPAPGGPRRGRRRTGRSSSPNRDGHGAWVNTPGARARRHHDRDTPDPADGRIERDRGRRRRPGTLHEGAMDLVERHIPPPTPRPRSQRGLARRPGVPPLARASPPGRTPGSTARRSPPTSRSPSAAS